MPGLIGDTYEHPPWRATHAGGVSEKHAAQYTPTSGSSTVLPDATPRTVMSTLPPLRGHLLGYLVAVVVLLVLSPILIPAGLILWVVSRTRCSIRLKRKLWTLDKALSAKRFIESSISLRIRQRLNLPIFSIDGALDTLISEFVKQSLDPHADPLNARRTLAEYVRRYRPTNEEHQLLETILDIDLVTDYERECYMQLSYAIETIVRPTGKDIESIRDIYLEKFATAITAPTLRQASKMRRFFRKRCRQAVQLRRRQHADSIDSDEGIPGWLLVLVAIKYWVYATFFD